VSAGERGRTLVRGFLRFAIAAILLSTAAGKLLDVRGFAGVLETYRAFPEWTLLPLAAAVLAAELCLALWLLSGRSLFAAGLASAGMHLAYAAWAAVTLARGVSVENCGCFGVFLARPLTGSTVVEDSALVVASVALALLSRDTA